MTDYLVYKGFIETNSECLLNLKSLCFKKNYILAQDQPPSQREEST